MRRCLEINYRNEQIGFSLCVHILRLFVAWSAIRRRPQPKSREKMTFDFKMNLNNNISLIRWQPALRWAETVHSTEESSDHLQVVAEFSMCPKCKTCTCILKASPMVIQ